MDAISILQMSDEMLADMYSAWSEDHFCAGWISAGYQEFVEWVLAHKEKDLEGHRKAGVQKIRRLLFGALDDN